MACSIYTWPVLWDKLLVKQAEVIIEPLALVRTASTCLRQGKVLLLIRQMLCAHACCTLLAASAQTTARA